MDKEQQKITVVDEPADSTPPETVEPTIEDAASVEPSDTTVGASVAEAEVSPVEEYRQMPEADNSTTVPADSSQVPEEQVAPVAPVVTAPKKSRRKKFVLIGSVATVALLAGGAATALLINPTKPSAQSNVSAPETQKKIAKMGVAVTLVDGVAEYMHGDGAWQTLTADSQLKEGDSIRTADARVVLTFDDGSALRLDANTGVRLESLVATNVKVAHTVGTTYSRVVPSERGYTVTVDGTEYKAMGTAFATTSDSEEKGVQVYQSSVKVKGVDGTVGEGKQYYSASADAARKAKVTDINIDTAAENEFLQWNLGEDEKQQQFKEKLGVLPQVRQRAEEKAKQNEAERIKREQEIALKAKQEAERKAAEEKKKKEAKNSEKTLVTRGTMTATANNGKISWTYSGKAIYGYKLVYSKTNSTPTFGTDNAVYYGSQTDSTGTLPTKDIPKGTYKIRVCAYTAGSENDPCVDYSNVVTIVKH